MHQKPGGHGVVDCSGICSMNYKFGKVLTTNEHVAATDLLVMCMTTDVQLA